MKHRIASFFVLIPIITLSSMVSCKRRLQDSSLEGTQLSSSAEFQTKVCGKIYGFLESEPSDSHTVGVYQGSFDPPTRAHIAIVEAAITKYGADKMFVLANKNGSKDYSAGIGERVDMLNLAFSKHGAKVKNLSVIFECKSFVTSLIAKKHRKTMNFIGYDSYEVLPEEQKHAAGRHWVVFPRDGATQTPPVANMEYFSGQIAEDGVSSSAVRKRLLDGGSAADLLTPEVETYIRENFLYKMVPSPWQQLQEKLWVDALSEFQVSIKRKIPGFSSTAAIAPFNHVQSAAGQADKMIRWVLDTQKPQAGEYLNVEKTANYTVNAKFEKLIYIQIPTLRMLANHYAASGGPVVSATPLDLSRFDTTAQKYNMDIQEYIGDRFPKALQTYVAQKNVPVFMHVGEFDQALAYHVGQGYIEIAEVLTWRGQAHRNMFLVRSSSGAERFVLTDIFGDDRFNHVARQIATMARIKSATVVRHPALSEFVSPTQIAKSNLPSSNDIVIIGFQNTVVGELEKTGRWKALGAFSAPELKAIHYSHNAFIDILAENSGSKRKIFLSRNVYGDEVQDVLNYFYSKGVRKFIYMGTAGGVSDRARMGTVFVPTKFTKDGISEFSVPNGFVKDLASLAISESKQGWVAAVLEESVSKLMELKKFGVDSLDIECLHVAEFTKSHPEVQLKMAVVISDETLGKVTLEEYADIASEQIRKAVASMLPKVFANLD